MQRDGDASHIVAFNAVVGNALGYLNWTDSANGPGAVQFTEPTVVNGHVYAAGESILNNNFNPGTGAIAGLCGVVGMCYGAVTVWY